MRKLKLTIGLQILRCISRFLFRVIKKIFYQNQNEHEHELLKNVSIHVQGDNKVAGQAFLALWAKRIRILKKCKYVSKDIYLSFKKC